MIVRRQRRKIVRNRIRNVRISQLLIDRSRINRQCAMIILRHRRKIVRSRTRNAQISQLPIDRRRINLRRGMIVPRRHPKIEHNQTTALRSRRREMTVRHRLLLRINGLNRVRRRKPGRRRNNVNNPSQLLRTRNVRTNRRNRNSFAVERNGRPRVIGRPLLFYQWKFRSFSSSTLQIESVR